MSCQEDPLIEANRFPSRGVTGRTGETSCRPRDGPDQHQKEKPLVNWKQEGTPHSILKSNIKDKNLEFCGHQPVVQNNCQF
ncbi:hypothetical protein JEQ12_019499 [Ovis aries]|uniref:Uncharacterized protein n=1 Tax=Ovis aries TaxID=9940 RepID=A0A836A1H6_SHEEP|nr:hypothetical protein JEQ12_019499 [Ovis aries]